ncbi:MAG: hypothetical protein GKS06_13830 [Acidobacteria bacterium]|nr:hypothetical protein [Acidobacteriota bacterium]
MKWILGLYPPAWQRRYRQEVEAHLAHEPFRVAAMANLVAGAIDAWMCSDATPESTDEHGEETMIGTPVAKRFGALVFYEENAPRSVALMLGVSLLIAIIGTGLNWVVGDHFAFDALLLAGFFIALTISQGPHLSPEGYSRLARVGFVASVCLAWYGFFLGVFALGTII